MIIYNTIKDFMRFINNATQEIIIRGAVVYNANNEPLAEYKNNEYKYTTI